MRDESVAAPTTRDVAVLLAEIGTLLELNGQDPFRARAFVGAARALEGVDADLHALAHEDRLTSLRGVGAGIAAVIREYLQTGRSRMHEQLRASTPLGMYDLLRVPALGPKRIHILHTELGVDSLDALESAASAGKIAALPGFGARTERKIQQGIAFARTSRQQRRYPEALEVAVRLVEWLREQPGVSRAEIAGQLRRRMEVVDRIDLVASSSRPQAVLEAFRGFQGAAELAEVTAGEASVRLTDGMTARLRAVRPGEFVGAMIWETGNDGHLEQLARAAKRKGAKLEPGGLRVEGKRVNLRREAAVYERIGLTYVPPELREGLDEVRLAAAGKLPRLVETDDLRGTFHCHTTYSDGKATLAEMAAAARARGWSYLGTGDHSRTASYAKGLPIEKVRAQHQEVDELNRGFEAEGAPFRIFKGIESDILPDGRLDYPDPVLRSFDYVIASVHSSFGMEGAEMTHRVIRAVGHPSLTILGHLTGRLLLTRSGYAIDVEAVLAAAAKKGVVVEINANPHRLDLDWRHVRTAAELGILIAINPDAHSVAALDHVAFGVNMARKAGLRADQVLNTWTLEEVAAYFSRRRGVAG